MCPLQMLYLWYMAGGYTQIWPRTGMEKMSVAHAHITKMIEATCPILTTALTVERRWTVGDRMKAKSYKLKYTPTNGQLIDARAKLGGIWINKNSKLYISKFFELPEYDFEFSIDICFKEDISDWNDFDNVLVLDEDFGQPYTPFYGKNYKKEISNHPCLEYCIEKYNEFMDSFDFLCEVSE